MAAPFGPRFALSAALFAALRGGLAGGVGFREGVSDRPDRDIVEIERGGPHSRLLCGCSGRAGLGTQEVRSWAVPGCRSDRHGGGAVHGRQRMGHGGGRPGAPLVGPSPGRQSVGKVAEHTARTLELKRTPDWRLVYRTTLVVVRRKEWGPKP